ncbi:hypothetical protein M011DRAFT_522694 [Sporormia fimetaria CBS 119925]|uniref:Uncharacterized protein n=1 Tax=Sporormia fimetaria CBS 119925 TaxID=1340428 RepID=A0A6A6VNJ2_9PLEO|nr:hypothetical protein M011DRAFT_522694 [Sporormia fimetaria CBS 119925]
MMFSFKDLMDIVQALPPKDAEGSGLPEIVPCVHPEGTHLTFITGEKAATELTNLVHAGSGLLSPSQLGEQVGISTVMVNKWAEATPDVCSFTKDNKILSYGLRCDIQQQLQQFLEQYPCPKAVWAHTLRLESKDRLIKELEDEVGKVEAVDGFYVSQSYKDTLAKALRQDLEQALRDKKQVQIVLENLPGSPPKWLVSGRGGVLEIALRDVSPGAFGRVQEDGASITCVPLELMLENRDLELEKLREGEGKDAWLDLATFLRTYPEVYTDTEDVRTHLASMPWIKVCGDLAVSSACCTKAINLIVKALEGQGYAGLETLVAMITPGREPPEELYEDIQRSLWEALATTSDINPDTLYTSGPFIMTLKTYTDSREQLLQLAAVDALTQWQHVKSHPDSELKFRLSDILASAPTPHHVLDSLSKEKSLQKEAETRFWEVVSRFEKDNEAEFATLWIDRVSSKQKLYTAALSTITEGKLRNQLSDLLAAYLSRDLIPDTLAKARSQGLLLSRKTKKDVQKLETKLQTLSDLTTLLAALDKFQSRQNIPELDDAALKETKREMVADMVRRMQKQKDGAALFLILVIVLLSSHGNGVIYATGKLAPKLLKLLKGKVGDEVYTRLEGWKDKARAGSLEEEDRVGMREMALKEVEERKVE